jgi:hypothetical protein
MLRKLGSYPRQNGFAIALRELGRASGLNLLTAAIVLWNTVYLERATNNIRDREHSFNDTLLRPSFPARLGTSTSPATTSGAARPQMAAVRHFPSSDSWPSQQALCGRR